MHFKFIVQFEKKSIMIIKFNKGVFVFTEKIQVIKLGHYTPYLATLTSLRHQDCVRKTLMLTAL